MFTKHLTAPLPSLHPAATAINREGLMAWRSHAVVWWSKAKLCRRASAWVMSPQVDVPSLLLQCWTLRPRPFSRWLLDGSIRHMRSLLLPGWTSPPAAAVQKMTSKTTECSCSAAVEILPHCSIGLGWSQRSQW